MCETFAVSKGDLHLDMNETLGEDEHDYRFVGRVGQFCPIKPGKGGGILRRAFEEKYYAPPGTLRTDKAKTPYRWLESEFVKTMGIEADIDQTFYHKLVDDAVETISKYGDFERFISEDPYLENAPWD